MGSPVTITPDPVQSGSAPVTITPDAPAAAQPTNEVHNEISAREGGVRGWLQDLSDDIKYGNTNTIVGKALKAVGAQPLANGVSEKTADFMGSPVLGTSRAARGAVDMQEGAMKRDPGQTWQGTKDMVGGLMDATQIPSSFVAPEAGEGVQAVGDEAVNAAKRGVQAIRRSVSPKAVTAETAQSLLAELNNAARDANLAPSEATSLSQRAADMASQFKAQAKKIYSALDEASGGRFQRFRDEISNIENLQRNATNLDDSKELEGQLADARSRFEDMKDEMVAGGKVDPDSLAQADAHWARAKALETVGKKFRQAETLSGDLKSTPAVLDNAVKAIDTARPGTLERAVGADSANVIRSKVVGNTKAVANATRNKRIATSAAKVAGAGAVGSTLLHALGGDSK